MLPTKIIEPRERFRELLRNGKFANFDSAFSPHRLFELGPEMVAMAKSYQKEGDLEFAFLLYVKFVSISLNKVKNLHGYRDVPNHVLDANAQLLKQVVPRLEDLKWRIMDVFQKEFDATSSVQSSIPSKTMTEEKDIRFSPPLYPLPATKYEPKEPFRPPPIIAPPKVPKPKEPTQPPPHIPPPKVLKPKYPTRPPQTIEPPKVPKPKYPTRPPPTIAPPKAPKPKETTRPPTTIAPPKVPKPKEPTRPPPTIAPPKVPKPKEPTQPPTKIAPPKVPVPKESTQPYSKKIPPPVYMKAKPKEVVVKDDAPLFNGHRLRTIFVPRTFSETFKHTIRAITEKEMESCGNLFGYVGPHNNLYVDTLVIVSQKGQRSYVEQTLEGDIQLMGFFANNPGVMQLGWIHTHPVHPNFMSSTDMHTQYIYQSSIPEAIGIVCSGCAYNRERHENKAYHLSEIGLNTIKNCKNPQGGVVHFHDPYNAKDLYQPATHLVYNDNAMDVVDLRPEDERR
uniref:MPN domain-containing protein n=1 Tax=Timema cristinae TaxID=61476 RepID=A0A7R9CDW6_TIMCR|nr:unnamed protein product [Timema cristinae]